MPMNEGYSPMPSAKKMVKPGVAKRISDRKAFVAKQTSMPKRPGSDGADSSMSSNSSAKKMARQKFFVQTRMAEMKAKGKTVTPEMRKQLQQKFQSGDVARKGFAAPKKKAVSSSSSSSSSVVTPKATTKVAPRSATSNMKGISGYGRTDSSGRTGMGATAPRTSAAGRGKGGEMMGSNKSSSAQSGKFAPKNKTPLRGSKY